MRWIVTGGAGFIGSCFVREAVQRGWADEVVVFDALTYAGNAANLAPLEGRGGWRLVQGDVCRADEVANVLQGGADAVFHFAAESHVDRSIMGAAAFVQTNVVGTQVLLDAARKAGVRRFVHVSTDEVYGSLDLNEPRRFREDTPLDPTSPYAASKAASDHMVLAAARTHGMDALVTRCSNNYGPYQFPEKFIPLFVTGALQKKKLPLYGDGKNVRDWIYVGDHVQGIYLAYKNGRAGGVYNFGGQCERANRDIAESIVELAGASTQDIVPVTDRLAHDRRYAVDCSLAQRELGFVPGPPIEKRLGEVVRWYQDNEAWWQNVQAGLHHAGADARAHA